MPYSRQSPDYSGEIAKLAREFPKEWADAHRFELGDRAYRFIKIAGWRISLKDARVGLNGKRGNPNDLSADALSYKNQTSPWGAEVIDCVAGAGGPNPQPGWNDVTEDTIAGGAVGVFVQPRDPGGTGTTPTPSPTPTPQPTPGDDMTELPYMGDDLSTTFGGKLDRKYTSPREQGGLGAPKIDGLGLFRWSHDIFNNHFYKKMAPQANWDAVNAEINRIAGVSGDPTTDIPFRTLQ